VLSQGQYGPTIASPAIFLKALHEYMFKMQERALKKAELAKKDKGATGGIRVVLPSPIVDPLLRPGQPPRPLRLLGQDPSKPIPAADGPQGTETHDAQRVGGSVPKGRQGPTPGPSTASRPPRPAPPPTSRIQEIVDDAVLEAFDPTELVEDFEHLPPPPPKHCPSQNK